MPPSALLKQSCKDLARQSALGLEDAMHQLPALLSIVLDLLVLHVIQQIGVDVQLVAVLCNRTLPTNRPPAAPMMSQMSCLACSRGLSIGSFPSDKFIVALFPIITKWRASLQTPAKWDDVISTGLAQQAYQDAMRLARRCREHHGITNAPQRATGESLTAVRHFLDDLGQAISAAPIETSPGAKTDDSAFVAAKTLREQRKMTASDCNKFLKQHGTMLAQSVEGKVRYRKPSKNRLNIHSGDWLTYWQEFDRRTSDALDDDAMQEFLANADAEKAKIRATRKRGRASARRGSELGKTLR